MAKRISKPQQGTSQTYSRPNARRPDAPVKPQAPQLPQILGPKPVGPAPAPLDNSLSQSLAGLMKPVLNFGLVVREEQQLQIKGEEELRLSRLDNEQLRQEMMKAAQEGEKAGWLEPASNPYRRKIIMETAATNIMNNEFYPALTKMNQRLSNPLNTEDPAAVARDIFENMGIQGFYANQQALTMYNQMVPGWVRQVGQQKNAKTVGRNKEDLVSSAYQSVGRLFENPVQENMDTLAAALQVEADRLYEVTGESGRSEIAKAIKNYIENQGNIAAAKKDSEALESFENFLEMLDEQEPGSILDLSGYGDDIDAAKAFIAAKIDRLGDVSEVDVERDVKTGMNSLYSFIDANGTEGMSTSPDSDYARAFRSSLEDQGLDQTAISRVMNRDYPTMVSKYMEDTTQSDKIAEDSILTAMSDPSKGKDEIDAIISANQGDLAAEDLFRLRSINEQRGQKKLAARAKGVSTASAEIASVARKADGIAAQIVNATGNEMEGEDFNNAVGIYARDVAENAALENSELEGEELTKVIRESVASVYNSINDAIKMTPTGIEINEEALPPDFPKEALEPLIQSRKAQAAQTLNMSRSDQKTTGDSGSGDLQLQTGWAWWGPMVDNIDDSVDAWKSVDTASSESRINELNPETRKDAARVRDEEFGVNQSGWGQTKKTVTPNGVSTNWGGFGEAEVDEDLTNRYLQAVRLEGLSPEEMASGKTREGLDISNFPKLTDPYMTLMVNADSFITDAKELASPEVKSLSEAEVLAKYSENGIVKAYNNYVNMVGVENAIPFAEPAAIGGSTFFKNQVMGIGKVTLPVMPRELRKALAED